MSSAWESVARKAGWLPPDEIEAKVWRAVNLNGERCRWCGAVRVRLHGGLERQWWGRNEQPQPHRTFCRFYSGPIKHAFANGHTGTFGYLISCQCGRNYQEYGFEGNRNERPDIALTHRESKAPDLTAAETP